MRRKLSELDDEKLIQFVENHPELFDPNEAKYKDIAHRSKLWNEIATNIGVAGESACASTIVVRVYFDFLFYIQFLCLVSVCKRRWKTHRDYFFREMKKLTWSAASGRDRAMFDRLHFLNLTALPKE